MFEIGLAEVADDNKLETDARSLDINSTINKAQENEIFKSAAKKLVISKEAEKSSSVLLFEISTANNVGIYREITFRELLTEILNEVDPLKLKYVFI